MKKKRLPALLLALCLICLIPTCTLAEEEKYTIGVIQLVQHEALDQSTRGFMERLSELLGGEDKVEFLHQNAQGDLANCATIVNGFVASRVDLIMANGTAALQTASNATDVIPVLGVSITDYASSLGLDPFDGATGLNVSGACDLAPLGEQAELIQELFPEAETVGILYCSAEPNSRFQADTIAKELTAMGYAVENFAFSDSNDLASVTLNACNACDVIYIPTDNTVASNAEIVNNICLPHRIPVITGDDGTCAICGVATLSVEYYDIGAAAGDMAYEILVGGADVSTMPIHYAAEVSRKYNAEICAELGIDIPEGYVVIGE